MGKYYILKDKLPVEVDSMAWGKWFDTNKNKIIKQQVIKKVRISTIFLGLDHSFGGGIPILFETMIFGGKHDQYQERYTTYEDAEAGHKITVALIRSKK